MRKLLFIIFYEAKDYLLYIKEQFEKYQIEVITYPLFRYAYDANDKIPDYKEHLNKFINETNPDIVLWWFTDVSIDVFKYVIQLNKNRYFIIYNSDDPINLNKDIFDKCKLFNLIVTPCNGSIYKYKLFSSNKNILFGPFGFDPNLHFPINPDEFINYDKELNRFSADISIYCHNLFMNKEYFPSQRIYFPDMITNLSTYAKNNNRVFKLYGPHTFKEYYPENYCGDVEYYNINMLHNFSKLNIVLHGDPSSSLAINQYVMSVLGSGGVLMIDNIKDIDKILTDGKDCLVLDDVNYIKQINYVLNNYNAYSKIKTNAVNAAANYSWDEWVKKIYVKYCLDKIDTDFYADLYGLDKNEDLVDHWKNIGLGNGEICYRFDVPDNFNHEEYICKFKLEGKSKEYAYLHWFSNSKNDIYLKRQSENTFFDPEAYNITIDNYYNICYLLQKLKNHEQKNNALIELNQYCNNIPYVKINEIIDQYLLTS